MANLNKVLLIGNLTRDPEMRHTPKGTAVADLGLAINRVWMNEQNQKQEETTFVDVTLWGRQAELAGQYLAKGRGVYIEGRLKLDSWDDKETGQKRSKLKVIGESLQFLPDGKGGTARAETRGEPSAPPPAGRPQGTAPKPLAALDDSLGEDDDIPF